MKRQDLQDEFPFVAKIIVIDINVRFLSWFLSKRLSFPFKPYSLHVHLRSLNSAAFCERPEENIIPGPPQRALLLPASFTFSLGVFYMACRQVLKVGLGRWSSVFVWGISLEDDGTNGNRVIHHVFKFVERDQQRSVVSAKQRLGSYFDMLLRASSPSDWGNHWSVLRWKWARHFANFEVPVC